MARERHFDEELEKLNEQILTMAALVESAIHNSIEALKKRDRELALLVIRDDKRINDLENTIEEHAIDLLALFQPMAKDLRFITTGMRINSELERIADLCVNICHRVTELAGQPQLKPLTVIPKLAQNAMKMVRGSIEAFVKGDEGLARSVIFSDKDSDRLRDLIMDELITDYIIKDGRTAPRAVSLLLISRDLERICDLAVNISEDTIYIVRAKVVKHHKEEL